MFDSNGGFCEGYWSREGNGCVTPAYCPMAGISGATNVYEFKDANSFIWRSIDRQVDGQPVSDVEVKFVRQAAK